MTDKRALWGFNLFLLLAVTCTPVQAGWRDKWKDRQNDAADSSWSQVLIKKEVSYGSDALQKLDIYAPKGTKALKPVHVYVHGGAWQIGDKKRSTKHGAFYADEGIVFVSVNYRLSPKDKHPAQAQDIAAAVKWAHDNIKDYGGDKGNIHLSGHSAGAHLVGLIGTDPKYLGAHGLAPSLFQTVIPVDTGSFDFNVPIVKGKRFVQPKIDETFGTNIKGLAEASPITYARSNKDFPRFLMFVTGTRPDAEKQTRAFHNALKSSGGESEVFVIEGLSHTEMNRAMRNPESLVSKEILAALLR